jgi:excisionase family DNA binding protein
MSKDETGFPKLPGYISAKEGAERLGISVRRINEYAQQGRIRAYKAGRTTMLLEEDVNSFQKQPVGRKRTTMPIWRAPTRDNQQYTTVIFANLRAGSEAQLGTKLAEIRAGKKHLLPGTVARYIARNAEKPNEIHILLIWRSTVMPSEAEREAALAALRADLAEIVDWDTAWIEQGQVLMHT